MSSSAKEIKKTIEICTNCKTKNLSNYNELTREISDIKQCLNCGWNSKYNKLKGICFRHGYPIYYWSNCKKCWDEILLDNKSPSEILKTNNALPLQPSVNQVRKD